MTTTSSYSSLTDSSLLSDYISSQTESATTETSDSDALWADYETFLNVLTTQLQNQDPTEPTDVSEFTAQLVQYAEVEQQIQTNDTLEDILSTMDSNGITPLLSYVGTYVEAPADGELVVQNGQAILSYTLDEEAESVTIEVEDSSGDVVATLEGATDAGLSRLIWDGTLDDDTNIADGTYTFTLTATDSDGDTIEVDDIRIVGCVTSIETNDDGDIVMKVGDVEINDEDVDGVWSSVGSATSSSDTTASSSDDTSSDNEDTTTEES